MKAGKLLLKESSLAPYSVMAFNKRMHTTYGMTLDEIQEKGVKSGEHDKASWSYNGYLLRFNNDGNYELLKQS